MELKNILSLLGGLSLFLYGMKMMNDGLEVTAGDKMQAILEKLTSNRFVAILVGALITAVIQSSSATTVMVVGFVNAGLMKLSKAVWVIMGANIGTTITGILISLKISEIAPIFAIVGVVMATFFNSKKVSGIGVVIGGLGILFIGMGMMSSAMAPLRDNAAFVSLMTSFSNPILGILAGAIFTAVIQSSSASIGILQTLAASGAIGIHSAVYVLFGQNIGTCITSFLASLSANRNAKRATLVHLMFNVIGTAIFVAIFMSMPFLLDYIVSFAPDNVMGQIANIHVLFNVTTTILLVPIGQKLVDLTFVFLPLAEEEKEEVGELTLIGDQTFGTTLVALSSLNKEIVKMFLLTRKSLSLVADDLTGIKKLNFEKIERNEKKINRMTLEINKFMSNISTLEMSEYEKTRCNALFKLSIDIERIGDHLINLAEYAEQKNEKGITLNDTINSELHILFENLKGSHELLLTENIYEQERVFEEIKNQEEKVDRDTYQFRMNQVERLQNKEVDANTGVVYSMMLTDLERISDYLLNVAEFCHDYELSFKNYR